MHFIVFFGRLVKVPVQPHAGEIENVLIIMNDYITQQRQTELLRAR